jgi:hypothetical protein
MSLTVEELRDLYTTRPDRFVQVRNDLVRTLKKAGRRDDADDLATRRRPSPVAWSLNRVAHEMPALIDEWRDAAAALRRAMHRAVEGDADAVRGAQAVERRAIDQIVTTARRHLAELDAKDADSVTPRIAGTLRAAALDEEVAQRLRDGTLESDVVASGFGFADLSVDELRPAPRPGRRTGDRSKAPPAGKRGEADVAAAKARDTEAARAAATKAREAEVARLAATAKRLDAAADRARRRADDLRTQVEQLQERLRQADREARVARNEAERAATLAARARTGANERD